MAGGINFSTNRVKNAHLGHSFLISVLANLTKPPDLLVSGPEMFSVFRSAFLLDFHRFYGHQAHTRDTEDEALGNF